MANFAFKKKLLSSAMAVAMVSGMVVSNSASAIHVAEDGIGQVLLAPYYTVLDGNKTKFKVVNTRTDVAVKAKVVIRSKAQTTEVLDFICYLSPADVCEFEIRNVNGQANFYSNDDSVRSSFSPVKFASQEAITFPLFDDRMKAVDPNDINEVGHVEIIGVYAARGAIDGMPIVPGMSKFDLVKIFDAPRPGPDGTASPRGYTTFSADPTLVSLSGSVQVVKEDNSDRMGYTIPALAGEIGDNVAAGIIDPGTAVAFDGRVISNTLFEATVAQETAIGNGFAVGGADNILEIEHALAVSDAIGTYEDGVNHNAGPEGTSVLVTFPTRYRHRMLNVCTRAPLTITEIAGALYTPPFQPSGLVKISMRAYDNQENSLVTGSIFSGGTVAEEYLHAEVNMYQPKWPYASGWYNLDLIPRAGCNYSDVPALAMTYKWMSVGGKTMNSMLNDAAHKPELTNR